MGRKRNLLRKLKNSEAEVRINSPDGAHLGKISKVGFNKIFLRPYAIFENLPKGDGEFITRCRVENEIELPLPIKSIPEKLNDGYIKNFVCATNYFSYKQIKNSNLGDALFEGLPFPTTDEIKILEGKRNEFSDEAQGSKGFYEGSGKIGFKY